MKDFSFNFTIYAQELVDLKFKKIQEEAKADMSQEEIMEVINKHLPNRLYLTQTLDEKSPNLKLFRVTFPYEGFDPNKKECYSHPPEEKTELGRANLKGSPVFYGAFDIGTALVEMKERMKPGAIFYLSLWEIKFSDQVHAHSLIYNSTTIDSNGILSTISQTQEAMLLKSVSKLHQRQMDGFKHPVKKMGDLFTTPSTKNYHLTSAYAHHILYETFDKRADMPILIYPSVQNKQNSLNFAIHPRLVKSDMMDLLQVFRIELRESDTEKFKIHFGHRGRFNGKKIPIWEQLTLSLERGDYKDLHLRTYDDTLYKGKEALKLKINNSDKTVKDWLDGEMGSTIFQAIATYQPEGEKTHPLEYEGGDYTQQLLAEYDHGNRVPTPKGSSCIHRVSFPLSWTNHFKECEPPIENGSLLIL